ncbi:autotransporter assembly complex protein TamA [Mameliella sediminis]|uniref:autotransporter assembly complex protein TamA n=1 Tax=Mameliella sediminis TaxID=2836866 RepID=UPI001C44B874|nr:autotransporter assembly complex family protein [Mameliella sediminis]MBV7393981.1 autotransporter assembly complex protein TamA [Mameliella sediminis]
MRANWHRRSEPGACRGTARGRGLLRGVAFTALTGIFLAMPFPAKSFDSVNFSIAGPKEDELKKTLRSVSILAQLEGEQDQLPQDILAAAQGDYARIVEALYAQGYYSAVVRITIDGREAATIPPFSAPDRIDKVMVRVEPGRVFRFGRTDVAPLNKRTAVPEGFAPGQPARATVVRDTAQAAIQGWREAGYAKATIADQSITARHTAAELDVALAVAKGRQFRFGDVRVTTDSAVRDARIRQIAGIPRGAVFDPVEVEDAAQRLRATGTFRSVTVTEAEEGGPDDTLDVLIEVTDRKPRRFGFGAELSSSDGVTLSGFWLHRNLFGGAERLRIEGEATQLGGAGMKPDYGINARFEKSAVYGADTMFYATTGLSYDDEPDYIDQKFSFGIGINREFSKQVSGELGIAFSRSKITDLYLPGDPTRTLTLLSLPTAVTIDRRDDPLNATEGLYLRAELEPFTLISGGDGGARYAFDLRGYRAFGADESLVLAGRLQLAGLFGPGAADAPPDFLLYSGGGGTVRGQPYQSLDVDYSGTRLGGRSFMGLSTELRYNVTDTIGVVGFADAGYVGAESFVDGSGDWHAGAGIGLRYDTPVGPIRFDVAGPVAGDTGDGIQIYIGIGQAF